MSIWKAIVGLFQKGKQEQKTFIRDDARTYEIGGVWGMSVQWFGDTPGTKVVGWMSRRPRIGDILLAPMQSGRIGKYVFTDVDYKLDPKDMFFGDVELIGVEEPVPLSEREAE